MNETETQPEPETDDEAPEPKDDPVTTEPTDPEAEPAAGTEP